MTAVRAAADRLLALGGAEVTHHAADTRDGSRVHHIESGAGDPLVLLHGGGGGSANWFRLIAPLARRFRVLAPDLPGFGESPPVAPTAPLGTQAASFLDGWLSRVAPVPTILAGTSFGALAAFRYAQAHPASVRSIVLIDAVGLGSAVSLPVRLAALPLLGRPFLRPSRAGGRIIFDNVLTGGRAAIPPTLRDALLDYLQACDAAGTAEQVRRSLGLFTGLSGQREVISRDELAAMRTRCLIVWGARDRFVPVAQGRDAAAHIPGARLVVIADAGHSPNWETPGEVLSALGEFLGADLGETA